jgi:hypothetical protein
MATKLGQYKQALRMMGDQRLASLDENLEARRLLDDAWDDACAYALRQGNWKFAKRDVLLNPDPDVTPAFGYSYVFSQPDDYVRPISLSIDEFHNVELMNFDEHNTAWFTNDTSLLYLRYVSNGDLYGMNLGAWPVDFSYYQAAHLAEMTALALTKSQGVADRVMGEAIRWLNQARQKDAIGNPVQFKPVGTWARSRLRGSRSAVADNGGSYEPFS